MFSASRAAPVNNIVILEQQRPLFGNRTTIYNISIDAPRWFNSECKHYNSYGISQCALPAIQFLHSPRQTVKPPCRAMSSAAHMHRDLLGKQQILHLLVVALFLGTINATQHWQIFWFAFITISRPEQPPPGSTLTRDSHDWVAVYG